MKKEVFDDLQKNPIDKAKYVRDSYKLGSNTRAIMAQRPHLPPASAAVAASRLEKTPAVQQLRNNIDGRILKLNKKSLNKLEDLIDSDSQKIALGAVSEARKTVRDYQDRREGKATQRVEKTSKKLIVHVSMKANQ